KVAVQLSSLRPSRNWAKGSYFPIIVLLVDRNSYGTTFRVSRNYFMKAEWAEQDWIWIGFPHDASLWLDDLVPAQEQIAAFANAVAESGQAVRLVVRDAANEMRARQLVSGAVACERHSYGDIWLRDSGPLVVFDEGGRRFARRFGFNGWGGKYEMEGDQDIGGTMAEAAGLPADTMDWILEGGAIDTDG